jgi:DNA repair exonuclease SbcCD ATPase subunit
MAPSDKDEPELVRAAHALESDIAKLEALPRVIGKIRLDSEKSITKAAKELNDALALPERLTAGLQAIAVAMAGMQARQQAALEPLAALASEIQQRMQRLGEHMQAFAALGTAASEVTALLQANESDRSAVLGEVDAQLSQIAAGARTLFEAARADDFPDVARQADALKQRVSALRKRLAGKVPPLC